MPLTVNQIIGGVRLYLRTPPESKLSNGMIAEYLLDKITYYLNELNMTDQNWMLEKWQLFVTNGLADYYVTPTTPWGRPILCETVDLGDPYHQRREIPIIDFQDRQFRYEGPNTSITATTYPHTAASMSLYTEGGQKKVRVDPEPAVPAIYRFWYEPARVLPSSFTDDPRFLENFGNLLKVDTAITALPDCEWPEEKHARIEKTVMKDLAAYSLQFDKYKTQDRQEQVNIKRAWADDWEF